MSMRNEQRDPLDALIDSAARQMTAGEASASLRGAVRDRIGARRPVWSLVPAWGAAVGVAIAALIVGRALLPLDFARGNPELVEGLGPPGERDNVRPTIELATTSGEPNRVRPTIEREVPDHDVVAQVAQRPRVRLTRRLADDVAAPPQEEEPLIPPIAVEPLQPVQIAVGNPIAVESSGVMPIEIEPLQIEPLRGIE